MLLSLDLSTSTGWALFNNGRLHDYGSFTHKCSQRQNHPNYPYNLMKNADNIANDMAKLIIDLRGEGKFVRTIVVEESNQLAKDRYAQKQLEFIHYTVARKAEMLLDNYNLISVSEWKKILGVKLSKEDREHNKLVKAKKATGKITNKHLTVKRINKKYNLSLLMKDNDKADAIAVGSAFLVKSGVVDKKEWEF